jgi:hypothetical protein
MPAKIIKVADLYVVEEDNKIVGVEFGFTDSITSKQGAVTTLDFCRRSLDSTGWVTKTVMGVKDAEASDVSDGSKIEQTDTNDTKE